MKLLRVWGVWMQFAVHGVRELFELLAVAHVTAAAWKQCVPRGGRGGTWGIAPLFLCFILMVRVRSCVIPEGLWPVRSNSTQQKHLPNTVLYSGVPRNFVRGGVQQIQLRTEGTGIWGR